MTTHVAHHEEYPDTHHDTYSKTIFGFWIFLVTDFLMFATVFASYAVLKNSTFGGPGSKELFFLPYNLYESIVMLLISFSAGIGATFAHKGRKGGAILLFWIACLLAILMAWLEFGEFSRLCASGNSWQRNAFLSAYFTLIGTHFFHLLFGILWSFVLIIPVMKYGLTEVYVRRLTCMKMFWMFLNIVWIFIFAFVYLMGVV